MTQKRNIKVEIPLENNQEILESCVTVTQEEWDSSTKKLSEAWMEKCVVVHTTWFWEWVHNYSKESIRVEK